MARAGQTPCRVPAVRRYPAALDGCKVPTRAASALSESEIHGRPARQAADLRAMERRRARRRLEAPLPAAPAAPASGSQASLVGG
jgi:hypothetical protein